MNQSNINAQKVVDSDEAQEFIKKMELLQEHIRGLPEDERQQFLEKINKELGENVQLDTVKWIKGAMFQYAKFRTDHPNKSVISWIGKLDKTDRKNLLTCLEMGGMNWQEFEWARIWLIKEEFQVVKYDEKVYKQIEAMRIQDARECIISYMFQGMFSNLLRNSGGKPSDFEEIKEKVCAYKESKKIPEKGELEKHLKETLSINKETK